MLSRRTLERDHRRLAAVLRPGMTVLDVGCGTGAITAGMARMIGPHGQTVGIDRDESLLAMASQEHQGIESLSFESGDVLSLRFEDCFDIVTAARTLQWVNDPELAVRQMKRAAKIGGRIVVLDYNHEDNKWEPTPPTDFARFYDAFLGWRTANGWSNRMADALPALFQAAGLVDLRIHLDDEIAERGDPEFIEAAAIWTHVIESLGPQLVASGHLKGHELVGAGGCYVDYVRHTLERQTLSMKTVAGTKPIA